MTPEREDFARRLAEVITLLGYPERGRQVQLAKRYKITQPSVRKWFTAESMPSYEIQLDLCKRAMVRMEWLLTGRGPKYFGKEEIENQYAAKAAELVMMLAAEQQPMAVRLLNSLVEPLEVIHEKKKTANGE